jgi:uncharacterized membrane protein
MSKFVVVTFSDEAAAYEGTRALKALDAEGILTLYGLAVVGRDSAGNPAIKQAADDGPLGTAVGALAGGLIGLIGGPVGVVVGAGGGAALGSVRDLIHLGVDESFVADVSGRLAAGQTAVIAEVAEEWVTPLDTRMEAIGGTVVRAPRVDVEDELYARDVAAMKTEVAALEAEFAQARTETRAKLKARLDSARTKLQHAADQADAWIERQRQETQAKVHAMQVQAAEARGDAKARFDRRAMELHSEYERRSAKLKEALSLTREALAP